MADHVVYLVDDDERIRVTLQDIIETRGYRVATAGDGEEALGLLKENGHRPCVMLLDLAMPRMNGLELLEAMRAEPGLGAIPVVVVSGAADRHALPPDVRLLEKPVHPARILEAVSEYCPGDRPCA